MPFKAVNQAHLAISRMAIASFCMPIFQEVDLISEARQVVALDQGNDHLHHYNMATIPLEIDPVP